MEQKEFRPMRRAPQQLSETEVIEILENATSGVLALLGDGDYPYTVPLSYVYYQGKLYFHGAPMGHKIDAMKKHPKASFCVIAQDDVIAEEYTTAYRSVIAFGQVKVLEEPEEIKEAVAVLAKKYFPGDTEKNRMDTISGAMSRMCAFSLEIQHMTGKKGKPLM